MNIRELPAVRAVAEAIRSAAARVQVEHPEWTPLQQLQAAKARCHDGHRKGDRGGRQGGADTRGSEAEPRSGQGIQSSGPAGGRGAAAEDPRIRCGAPGLTTRDLARHLKLSQTAISVALRGAS